MSTITYLANWAGTPVEHQAVRRALPQIPMGCICSYTWSTFGGHLMRNGALAGCPADHTEIDGTP